MIDKKFGGTIGINLAYAAEMTEDEVKRVYSKEKNIFLSKVDKLGYKAGEKYENICSVIKCLENYEYDSRVAVFMLLGIQYAGSSSFFGKKDNWPFGITKDGRTTAWCSVFQNVIQLSDFEETLNLDVSENGRLGRFGYQRLKNIEMKLADAIEKEQKQEDKLAAKVAKNRANVSYEIREEYDSLLCATKSRKENWILEDIVLGKSLSFTIYHWMRVMPQKEKINFEIFVELIRTLASLKCFQFRNIIADGVLRMIFNENDFSEKKIEEITEEVKGIVDIVKRYYKAFLLLKWHEAVVNSNLKDKVYRTRFMDIEANSLGMYIENGNSDSYLVERSISIIDGGYRIELENDLKKIYNAEYNYMEDKDILAIEGFPVLLINGACTADEKREHISNEERNKIKKGEESKKVKISTKKVMSHPSTLFTFIHWEIMKANGK